MNTKKTRQEILEESKKTDLTPDENYDSTAETLKHIKKVQTYLNNAAIELLQRANKHDDSKLESPEKELFDKYTTVLAKLEYGSDEYKESLKKLKPALDHHYANNSHHPEYYKNGIDDMDLFDILEMAVDWLAATERTSSGDIYKSIEINKERFKMSDQLSKIFVNTIKKIKK